MLNSVEDVLREILVENKDKIVDLVRYEQLAIGLNSKGEPLSWKRGDGTYSPYTQGFATKQGLAVPKTEGAPYNFQWTGDTFDFMSFRLKPKTYEIFTSGEKMRLFQSLGYGDIFSLTEEHNDYVNKNILEPELVKWIEDNWWRLIT